MGSKSPLIGLALALAGLLAFTSGASAAKTETISKLACPGGATLYVYTPNVIAKGRDMPGVSWASDTSVAWHPTIQIRQAGKVVSTMTTSGQTTYSSVGNLPVSGALSLTITSKGESGSCTPVELTIPRTKGYSGLETGVGPQIASSSDVFVLSLAKSTWTGLWTGDTDDPSGTWQVGSCTPLLNDPIIISYATSGVAGTASKTLRLDACKLAPPGVPATKIRLPQAIATITRGALIISPTLRTAGSQSYRVTAKWGASTKRAAWKASWVAPRTIWQGTDDFINVCINEGLQTYSKNGRLYCTVQGYVA